MASKIIWEENGFLVKHSGTVTDEEVMMVNDIMYGDARFEKISYQIADFTDVTDNRITHRDAKVIGTMDRTSSVWNSKKMKIAIVTTDEKFLPVVKAYLKELEGMNWEGRSFKTLEMAHAWARIA